MKKGIPYESSLKTYPFSQELEAPNEEADVNALLRNFHPDHKSEMVTQLQIGVNKGEQCHVELAKLLQSDARIDEADLAGAEVIETDVLVIGGGGAGCAAALEASQSGARVIMATKLRLGDSNTVMAEGGIQASIEDGDTPQMHFEDTMRAGHGLSEPNLVSQLVLEGPETVRWLIRQGMQFDLDEYGNLLTRRAGGTSAPRVAYYRDYTGLEMMRVLRESVFNSNIQIHQYQPVVELLMNENHQCAGAVVLSLKDEKYIQIKAATAVILATGGIGRMHLNGFPTSNHFGATGDGLTLAYRLGAKLRELDSFQYHPTGLAYPHHMAGTLITEGVRSAGTYLLNAHGERFVDELKPRDHVAAAILRECEEGRGVVFGEDGIGVWLDTPGIEKRIPGILMQKFPKLIELGKKCGVDPRQLPMLIYPTLHYQNGGIKIDSFGQTNVSNLYSVGEVSGGIHGKNRLMGNALQEIISFGRRAGKHAASRTGGRGHKKVTIDHLSHWRRELALSGLPMTQKGPMLFPECAKYKGNAAYDGVQRNGNGE